MNTDARIAWLRPRLLLWLAIPLCAGCSQFVTTNPPRSVTEQLLISTAADRALQTATLTDFAQKKVFLDGTYYESYDAKYVLGTIRDALSRSGALLVNEATNSDIVIEARSGGLSIDASDVLIGLPSTGIPIPLAGVLPIPELALFKSTNQRSMAKLALLAYDTKSRQHLFSSGELFGKAHNNYYKFLGFIQWTGSDLPEKNKK